MGKITYIGRSLLPQEFMDLRAAINRPLDYGRAASATRMDLFSVVVLTEAEEPIGCCRVLGDGVTTVWLQDLIVAPKYQRRGVGTKIVELVFTWLAGKPAQGLFVGCMAAPGTEGFFARLGFAPRPADAPGMELQEPLRPMAGRA